MRNLTALACSMLLVTLGCGDDAASDGGSHACKKSLAPIVMVHGFLAAADTWTSFAQRFEANGYCPESLYAVDWNTLKPDEEVATLAAVIDGALAKSGVDQIDLIAHSAGGGLAYAYLADPAHAAKVDAYAHVCSEPQLGPAGPEGGLVPTLNLKSSRDAIIVAGEIPGAINLLLADEDHYQCATSVHAFEDVYSFLNGGKQPKVTAVAESHPFDDDAPRVVAGKALTMGENVPAAGWTIDVYEVDAATGKRKDEVAEATFTVAADGGWGPFDALPRTFYQLHLHGPGATDRAVHYYREPFVASNRFMRLRSLPAPGTLVAALFAVIPFEPEHAVLIAFSSSQAVVAGRDTLTVAGETLSTEALASAQRTAIAFFLFDEGADQKSSDEVDSFKNITDVFLTAIDRFLPASDASLTLTFDGRTLNVPALASDPNGAIVATFD